MMKVTEYTVKTPIRLIGLALPGKTTNDNGQSMVDCGSLWQRFEKEAVASRVPGKVNENVIAVYHQYDGDYTQAFSYFIGCPVEEGVPVPEEMDELVIPGGAFEKVTARGQMPACIAEAWQYIWRSDMDRAYHADYEIYDERSLDWNKAEVDIYISVK
ncbi:GyrI-like domain-containing protein [Prolixibacter sp. NT017]|jgi:predicted transcriptional regulator YdeE|uniref:GyrI-like domain-containing protein n=1 Tax=Prolixibacter sp. NT017 TaxID=2652390 RepID=UPI001273C9FC|nr:GyrI-like domain-containing protein [Prolixibacter sp. NT017]GET26063.1 DNA-binding protein [Prolixibacter sp. NT017]